MKNTIIIIMNLTNLQSNRQGIDSVRSLYQHSNIETSGVFKWCCNSMCNQCYELQVIQVRNNTMHSACLQVSNDDMKKALDKMVDLLEQSNVKDLAEAKAAVRDIIQVNNNTLMFSVSLKSTTTLDKKIHKNEALVSCVFVVLDERP